MMTELASILADLAANESLVALETLRVSLLDGRITRQSNVGDYPMVLGTNCPSPSRVAILKEAWERAGAGLPSQAIAFGLLCARRAAEESQSKAPRLELVWTGESPPTGSCVRSTEQTIREMIRCARERVLVVGYDLREASERILDDLREARRRGCIITAAFEDNGHNLERLAEVWPGAETDGGVRLLKWRGLAGDPLASLHAKVIAVDQGDVLITSANLTLHGLERNLELGVRIRGGIAWDVVRHFARLERDGILVPST